MANYTSFITANTCPSRGTFANGEIYYDRSAINGKYPVSTIAFYSCSVGYMQPTSQSRSAICLDSGSWGSPGVPKRCIADTGKSIILNIINYDNINFISRYLSYEGNFGVRCVLRRNYTGCDLLGYFK